MSTAAAFVEVEPTLKRQAEEVLDKIGLSFSDAVNLFTRQIVLRRAFPVELKIDEPVKKPLCIEDMSEKELDAAIQKGFDDIKAGRCYTSDEMKERMASRYGIKF